MAEALWRHAAVEELSKSWEVGRDGDEHSQGLAERQQAARTDLLSWLVPAPGLAVPEPGRTGATGGCQSTKAEHSLGSLQFCLGDQL